MGIDLYAFPLWAELATWRRAAQDAILRPEYWAIRGTTRMGTALTFADRYEDDELAPEHLDLGVQTAAKVMALLGEAERAPRTWRELPPPAGAPPEAIEASAGSVERVAPEWLELLLAVAHAVQHDALPADADAPALLRTVAEPPSAAPRARGPMSALLAASLDTVWIPVPLLNVWDSPMGTIASSVQLRADLALLPALLQSVDPQASTPILGAQDLVHALRAALDEAGDSRCIRISG